MRVQAVVVAAGVIVTSAVTVGAETTPFHLTVAPAFALVAPDQRALTFIVVNSNADPVTLSATSSDAWVAPAEQSFVVPGHDRHEVKASIVIPPNPDAGDHETDVQFTLAPQANASPGMIRISWAIASRVIIATGGQVVRGLHIFGLTAPRVADSWDRPNVSLTLDNSHSNVHEVVDVAPFGQALVLRGQTRVLAVPWSAHPFIGVGSVTAGNESVSTLFIPWKLALGGLWFALVFLLTWRWQHVGRRLRGRSLTSMDDATAFGLLGSDPQAMIVNGRREEAVMVRGYEPTSGFFQLDLRTRIGEPQRHVRVHRDNVELAP